ncbi:hypothetical protein AB2S62_06350 [Vibrio sp. NTOU-M3]|uniref:hypothetical protein n=1 Tax=Vibrio sp. NTOU-M3 TaxID=3234954 RepID=UPI0035A8D5A7
MPFFFRTLTKAILLFPIVTIISSCSQFEDELTKYPYISANYITQENMGELSGIALSKRNPGVIWVGNDNGNTAELFAINAKGERIVTLEQINGAHDDWEDLAIFEHDGKSYIMIADVGDNGSQRPLSFFSIIEEPDLSEVELGGRITVKPAWVSSFSFEDRPRDCEAVAIDSVNNKILLLSKRTESQILYELPLTFERSWRMVAKRLGEITPLPEPEKQSYRLIDLANYTNKPTSMDISEDGLSAVVLTYGDAFIFKKDTPEQDWLSTLNSQPERIPLPVLKQGEAIAFGEKAEHVFITSEKLPAPLLNVNLRQMREE